MAGTDKPAITMELRPEKKSSSVTKAKAGGLAARLGGASQSDVPVPTGGESVDDLKKQIADLQAKLGGGQDSKEDLTTKPKLGYWDIRGLGAQIRYMFAYLKVDYDYVPYACGDGPDFDKTSWTNVKETMGFEYPNLPYLEDGKTKITETFGIMKYIAKKYDPSLLGRSAADLGRIEMLAAHVASLKGKATMPCYVSGDVNEITENCRPILKALAAAKGNSKWIAGNDLSWLDFAFAELLDMLDKCTEGVFYQEFPAMKEYFEAFVNLPGMAEYWQNCQKAPFNNKMAKLLNK
jgi:glutathione S-transferase